MSSSMKRVARKQELAKRKAARKSMRVMERVLNSMPKNCSQCNREFDPNAPRALDEWRATVSPTGISIACPLCSIARGVQQGSL
jgi:hypothetical protein